jgi:hypothetical protein
MAPVSALVILVVFVILAVRSPRLVRDLRQDRYSDELAWRKRHRIRRNRYAAAPPPMPFHVATKIADNPYAGVSTRDTDKFLAAVRRWFGSAEEIN